MDVYRQKVHKKAHKKVHICRNDAAVIDALERKVYHVFTTIPADSNDANPLRYAGEYQDLCSGLVYLRNRYYDPSVGRFISEDPIQDGLNW